MKTGYITETKKITSMENNCAECPMRAKYDAKPKSFAGRFWRFHINFCPGWKQYMNAMESSERNKIAKHYNIKKYMN